MDDGIKQSVVTLRILYPVWVVVSIYAPTPSTALPISMILMTPLLRCRVEISVPG